MNRVDSKRPIAAVHIFVCKSNVLFSCRKFTLSKFFREFNFRCRLDLQKYFNTELFPIYGTYKSRPICYLYLYACLSVGYLYSRHILFVPFAYFIVQNTQVLAQRNVKFGVDRRQNKPKEQKQKTTNLCIYEFYVVVHVVANCRVRSRW